MVSYTLNVSALSLYALAAKRTASRNPTTQSTSTAISTAPMVNANLSYVSNQPLLSTCTDSINAYQSSLSSTLANNDLVGNIMDNASYVLNRTSNVDSTDSLGLSSIAPYVQPLPNTSANSQAILNNLLKQGMITQNMVNNSIVQLNLRSPSQLLQDTFMVNNPKIWVLKASIKLQAIVRQLEYQMSNLKITLRSSSSSKIKAATKSY